LRDEVSRVEEVIKVPKEVFGIYAARPDTIFTAV
jgi:hypothetical protein